MAARQLHQIRLDEDEMPTRWYNVLHDLPTPPPPVLHPGTGQPIGPEDLAPLFPMALIEQEVSTEQYVDIPEEVQDVYRLWRPSPLFRAHRLEKALGLLADALRAPAFAEAEIERLVRNRLDEIPHDDEPTFEAIRTTHTLGMFQIESPGQRELIGKMQPDR